MARYVIDPEVALLLAERQAVPSARHTLLAPTLLRSQVLAELYGRAGRGTLSRHEAGRRLDHLRKLRLRLLGDRVLQRVAWDLAAERGWPDTFAAEYLALARLQADALVTMNAALARGAEGVTALATIDDLLR